MLKENKSTYISRIIRNIPDELKQLNQWVVHENKIPFDAKTTKPAQSNNKDTWRSFQHALDTFGMNGYHGVGFMFQPPYVGVDIDKSTSLDIPSNLLSYTEYSFSGNGLHVICKGTIPRALKKQGLEIYTERRFFTMTGRSLDKFPKTINTCTDQLKEFFKDEEVKRNESGWVEDVLDHIEAGNIHNSTIKVVGLLHRKGLNKNDIRALLLPKIREVHGDIRSFEQRLESVTQYKRPENNYEKEEKQIEIFTPAVGLAEYEKEIAERGKHIEAELSTGFRTLDGYTHGLKKGSIWVVGARTGIGKTSFSINVASKLLELGKRVLFFSTEMAYGDILDRLLSLKLGIDLFDFESSGWKTSTDKEHYERVRGEIQRLPIFICPEPEPTIREVSEAVSRVRPDVLIVDHIQRIANSTDKRYLEISRFIKELNTVCRKNNVAGIVNSQLNRLAEQEIPGLHHLRECGSLEEEAHAVLLLSRLDKTGELVLIDIAKNRGPKGQVEVKFDKKTCKFEEV